ncbi:hypothetical protein [Pantanalinema sp. GBBB05]|uniref:hypothetical protein n=1 Tax=Pantanalinema sp. GBBB05 TaxID=2604139 RepID=UPI001D402B4D|nr:hypothetical protein [Pantanalinema sp. GBBB05]
MPKTKAVESLASGMKPMETITIPMDDPSPDIYITKIKISAKDASLLKYDRASKNHEVEHCEMPFFSQIHPDFQDALNYFRGIAIEVVGLDEEAWDKAIVSGVSIKHSSEGIGLTITMQRKLEYDGLAIVVNTPYLSAEFLTREKRQIDRLIDEAIACLDGKRAQMDLFGGGGEA